LTNTDRENVTMAHKKPGSYRSRGYAIRSRPLDLWVNARTWGSDGTPPGQNIVRYIDLVDHPVQLTSNETAMRRIIAALPARITEEMNDLRRRTAHVPQRLNEARARQDDIQIRYWQEKLDHFEQQMQQLRDLMNGPLDMVEITRETTITHQVVP
jgi:hypothetical protein